MWKNLRFSVKTWILAAVFIAFTILTGYGYHMLAGDIRDMGIEQSTEAMMSGYKNELKDIVDVMALSLSSAVQHTQDEFEIHNTFTRLVQRARFLPDKSGYFFIYKVGGIVFVHAAKPGLEGKKLIDLQDPDGKYLIRELEAVSISGGGYVEYWWDKPGQGLQPKLSYSRMIPGTPYWIGTGVYIDDIKEKKESINNTINDFSITFLRKLYISLAAIFLLIIAPITIVMIRSIVTPLIKLTYAADQFSLGKLEWDFPELGRKDEIGKLSKALERLGTSIKVAIQMMEKQGKY